MRCPRPIFFPLKNSEILAKHSLGIDTSFATMSDPSTPNLKFLVQAIRELKVVIKLPIGDFELGLGVFRIGDWGLKSQIPNPKNTNSQFKMTNWQFYHYSVIFTFSSLITMS